VDDWENIIGTMTEKNDDDSYDGRRRNNIDQHETGDYPSDGKYGMLKARASP
jgi:hypothetical protein